MLGRTVKESENSLATNSLPAVSNADQGKFFHNIAWRPEFDVD